MMETDACFPCWAYDKQPPMTLPSQVDEVFAALRVRSDVQDSRAVSGEGVIRGYGAEMIRINCLPALPLTTQMVDWRVWLHTVMVLSVGVSSYTLPSPALIIQPSPPLETMQELYLTIQLHVGQVVRTPP